MTGRSFPILRAKYFWTLPILSTARSAESIRVRDSAADPVGGVAPRRVHRL